MNAAPRRTIDLRACQTLGVSLPDEAARRASLRALAERLGLSLSLLDAVRCSPSWLGCGLSHIAALRAWDGARPLLVLEDDVAAEAPFSPLLEVPADADAVYVGVSLFGLITDSRFGFGGLGDALALEPAGPGLFRVHNMLSTHAILHLTPRWRAAALEVMIESATARGWAPDIGLATIQSDFRVYALERPLFYQSAALQGEANLKFQERATRTHLTAAPVGSTLTFNLDGVDQTLVLQRDGERLAWGA